MRRAARPGLSLLAAWMSRRRADGQLTWDYELGWQRSIGEIFAEDYVQLHARPPLRDPLAARAEPCGSRAAGLPPPRARQPVARIEVMGVLVEERAHGIDATHGKENLALVPPSGPVTAEAASSTEAHERCPADKADRHRFDSSPWRARRRTDAYRFTFMSRGTSKVIVRPAESCRVTIAAPAGAGRTGGRTIPSTATTKNTRLMRTR